MAWIQILLFLSFSAMLHCISLQDIELPTWLTEKQSSLDESSALGLKELIENGGIIPKETCKAVGFLCGTSSSNMDTDLYEKATSNLYIGPLIKSLFSASISSRVQSSSNLYADSGSRRAIEAPFFFRLNALRAGSKLMVPPLHDTNNDLPNKFLPPCLEEVMKKSNVPQLLSTFNIPMGSRLAQSMEQTEYDCSKRSTNTETKICVASIQSILAVVTSILSPPISSVLKSVTSLPQTAPTNQHFQVIETVEVTNKTIVTCHPSAFPYTVYMCHTIPGTKLFKVILTHQDQILEIPAICHMETSTFDADDISLKALGIKPGEGEVCHWLPNSSISWYM